MAVAIRVRAAANATIFSVHQIADAESRPVRPLRCGPVIAARIVDLTDTGPVTVADCSVVAAVEDADTDVAWVADCSSVDHDTLVPRLQQQAAPLDTIHVSLMLAMDAVAATISIAVVSIHVDEAAANCLAASRKNHRVAGEVASAGCSIIMAVQEAATRVAPIRLAAVVVMPLRRWIPAAVARATVDQDV